MQQYFDGPVILNRDEAHLKMTRFLKASGCDRQKHNPCMKCTFDREARDINSLEMFVSSIKIQRIDSYPRWRDHKN